MATRKPRTNNAIKAQAREHQKTHPGTTYTAARESVTAQGQGSVRQLPSPLDRLVGQPEAKRAVRNVFRMEALLTERALRAHKARGGDTIHEGRTPPPPVRKYFPKVHISGPSGTGKTTLACMIYDETVTPAPGRGLTQVDAQRLLGRHLGEAQSIIQPLVESAEGGMLLIDNIDAITGHDDALRTEALTVLAEEIRLVEHNLAVGVVGSPHTAASPAAQVFLGMFPTMVTFTSITPDDARVFVDRFTQHLRLKIEPSAVDEVARYVERLRGQRTRHGVPAMDALGNARFIRNTVARANENLAARLDAETLGQLTDDALVTLTREDVIAAMDELLAAL